MYYRKWNIHTGSGISKRSAQLQFPTVAQKCGREKMAESVVCILPVLKVTFGTTLVSQMGRSLVGVFLLHIRKQCIYSKPSILVYMAWGYY